jgi:AraC-like DNA-binding protein
MRQKRPSAPAGYGLQIAHIRLDPAFPFAGGGRFIQRDAPITHLHIHDELELGYCHAGTGIFVIEDKVLPYHEGCISVISEREMHLAQSTPGTTSSWSFLSVDPARLLAGSGAAPDLLDTAGLAGRGFANIIAPASDPEICRLVAILAGEGVRRDAPGHREAVRGLVLAIMARLHRLPGRGDGGGDRSAALHRLAPALGYLGVHYHEDLDVPTLAAVCGLSPTHFRRRFTAAFGQGPLAYVVRFRLEKAAALLRDGRTPVLEAALRCGFRSLSAFQRHFRTAFGCPPRTWRRRPG